MRLQHQRARRLRFASSLSAGALLLGCGSDGAPKDGFSPPPPPNQPVLVRVQVAPETVSLQPGMAQQFSATGELTDGSTRTIPAAFSATGGSVTSEGLYTAGSVSGNYQVIAVEQNGTLADTASVVITTTPDLAPTANANGPYSGTTGSAIAFSSAGSFDPEGSWTASWDFGDGATATGTNPSHSYSNSGSYSATLTVTDQVRQTASDVATVSVTSGPRPTTLVQESFDDGNFSARGWYDGSFVFDATESNSGAGSIAATFTAGSTTPPGKGMRILFSETDRVHLTYYVKYSSNYVGSSRAFDPHEWMFVTNEDGAFVAPADTKLSVQIQTVHQAGTGIMVQFGATDNTNIDQANIGVDLTGLTELRGANGCNGFLETSHSNSSCFDRGDQFVSDRNWNSASGAITEIEKTAWNKIEAFVQLNTITGGTADLNGILRWWVNDVLVIEHTGVVLRTGQYPNMKFNQLFLKPSMSPPGSPVTQTIWYDDLLVTTGS